MPTQLDWPSITAAAVALLAIPLAMLIRTLVVGRFERLARRTRWQGDDEVVASLRRPLVWWLAVAGWYAASRIVDLPASWATLIDRLLLAILLGSATFWMADLTARLIRVAAARSGGTSTIATGVVLNVTRLAVFSVGILVLLSSLGVSITPILTTVGVGGLAVALGLQDTLANIFAGVHVTLAGNIRVGDYIKLESGEEGYVEDIKWRATRIRTLAGNIVLIPNGQLARSIVTNFHLPAKDMAVLVEVGVHYASELEQVERVIVEVARSVLASTKGAVADFDPFIRYHTFGESSIDLTVILRVEEFTDQYLVKHEFIKALAARFAKEQIVIPFPIRAVNLSQESADQPITPPPRGPGPSRELTTRAD